MKIDDILTPNTTNTTYSLIKERCSQYITESNCYPLLMNLPSTYHNFHKVKVRKRKQRKEDNAHFASTFNSAFQDEKQDIRERAVFANGTDTFCLPEDINLNTFYIFPIDGYKFMYSKEVENSSQDYKNVVDTVFGECGSKKGNEIITELLRFTYTSENLMEGIQQGSEIIIYNIPYFYAIRKESTESYTDLLTYVENSV